MIILPHDCVFFYKVSKFELTVELTIEQTENDKVKNSFSLFFMEKTCCKHCQLQEQRTHQSSKACCRCHLGGCSLIAAVNELFQLEIR